MKDIRIAVLDTNYIVVTATTKRFGKNEVMFEGNTFAQCFDYVKRVTGKDSVNFTCYLIDGSYVDREGKEFPNMMYVY